MKKATIHIAIVTIVALTLSLGAPIVSASEVTGTISTGSGSGTGTQTNTGGNTNAGGNTNTSTNTNSNPSTTPNPTYDSGHKSELAGGNLSLGGTVQGGVEATSATSTASTTDQTTSGSQGSTQSGSQSGGQVTEGGTTTAGGINPAVTAGLYADYSYVAHQYNLPGSNSNQGGSSQTASTTTEATTTPLTADELAHLSLSDFGPRYGVGSGLPGAPYAGGSYGGGGSGIDPTLLTVGQKDTTMNDIAENVKITARPFVPRSGEGTVADTDLAANVLTSAGGLSISQLVLIALLGLILLASIGYAISRHGDPQVTA